MKPVKVMVRKAMESLEPDLGPVLQRLFLLKALPVYCWKDVNW